MVELARRDVGEGPPLVLLHAFPLHGGMWRAQQDALADRHRVVVPDQRGFGASPLGDDPPSLDRAADDLVALLDRLELERVVLGGLSMGGYVALAVLRRHPDRVRALVLADTRAGADAPDAAANRERMARRVTADPGGSLVVDEVVPTLVGATTVATRPAVVDDVRRMAAAAPAGSVAWAQRAMAARPDSTATLAAAGLPVLVVAGEEDTLTPPDQAEAMAQAVAGARFVLLPGAGHLSAVETPAAFTAALDAFLADVG